MARTYRRIPINRNYRRPLTFNSIRATASHDVDLAELSVVLPIQTSSKYIPSARDDLYVGSHREYYPYRRWCKWFLKAGLKYPHLSTAELLARGKCSWVDWYLAYRKQRTMLDTKAPADPRNDEDYDTYDYGTEPLPGDRTWHQPVRKPKDNIPKTSQD